MPRAIWRERSDKTTRVEFWFTNDVHMNACMCVITSQPSFVNQNICMCVITSQPSFVNQNICMCVITQHSFVNQNDEFWEVIYKRRVLKSFYTHTNDTHIVLCVYVCRACVFPYHVKRDMPICEKRHTICQLREDERYPTKQGFQLSSEYCTDIGWLRLVGSLKLQVSFAECHLFCRALLQKRPIILRSLLTEATP